MNSDIYRALMEEYRLRREQNSRIESERENEVFSAHPDIERLCRERHRWILGGIDGILNGRDGALPPAVIPGIILRRFSPARTAGIPAMSGM